MKPTKFVMKSDKVNIECNYTELLEFIERLNELKKESWEFKQSQSETFQDYKKEVLKKSILIENYEISFMSNIETIRQIKNIKEMENSIESNFNNFKEIFFNSIGINYFDFENLRKFVTIFLREDFLFLYKRQFIKSFLVETIHRLNDKINLIKTELSYNPNKYNEIILKDLIYFCDRIALHLKTMNDFDSINQIKR